MRVPVLGPCQAESSEQHSSPAQPRPAGSSQDTMLLVHKWGSLRWGAVLSGAAVPFSW